MGLFRRGTPEQKRERADRARREAEERKQFAQWAKASVNRFHKGAHGVIGRGTWDEAEKRLREPVKSPANLEQPVIVRFYRHNDAKHATRMFELEAQILAERGYFPTTQSWSGPPAATMLLGGLGLLAGHTLTATYERRVLTPPAQP